jgi:hypothetical protein
MSAANGFCPHVSARLHISLLTTPKIKAFLLFFRMARQPLQSTNNQQRKLQMTFGNRKKATVVLSIFRNTKTEGNRKSPQLCTLKSLKRDSVIYLFILVLFIFFCEKSTNTSLTTECCKVSIVVIIKLQKCFMLITSF